MNYRIDYEKYQNDDEALKGLWEAAYLDKLTHLGSRYGMEKWISKALTDRKADQCAALMIIDLDNFKYVNDTFGHMLGDALLVEVADMIRSIFQENFICGRVGGDEYQIFTQEVRNREQIEQLADELCSRVSTKYEKQGTAYKVSVSIGIAYTSDGKDDYAELYRKADLALYQAKAYGKNGYVVTDGKKRQESPVHQTLCSRENQVEQIGESGFSVCKVLLDHVIRILQDNEDPRTAIEKVSREIVEAFDVTRAYASCYTPDGTHIGKSFFYAQDTDQNIRPGIALSAKEYEEKYFNQDHVFFCTDIEETMEPIRSELRRMGVQTFLQVLIYREGKIIGTVGINNCGYKRLWIRSEIEVIHTISLLLRDHIYRLQQCD